MNITYNVGELRRIITESSNEFKPVLGPNVERDNKSNSEKAYKDAKKRAKDFDGGLNKEVGEEKPKYEKNDFNRTTLDYNPENVDDKYKKRVHAQAKGYTSELEMNNKIEKSGDFSDNDNIYQGIKKSGEEYQKNKKAFNKSGLQSNKWPDETFDEDTMYESRDGFNMRQMINRLSMLDEEKVEKKPKLNENRTIKTVYFKRTTFLTEGHMLSRIPDEMKKDGEVFRMRDKTDNEYLVEWKGNKPCIIGHKNVGGMNESLDRMKSLFEYKTSDTCTDRALRLNEGENGLNVTLKRARKNNEKNI